MRRLGAAAALAIPLLCAGTGAAADDEPGRPTIYKWVDENGIAHYTTDKKRIPKNLRNRIRDVDELRAEQAAPAPAAGAAAATPPGAQPAPAGDAGDAAGSSVDLGEFAEGEEPLLDGDPGAATSDPTPATAAAAATSGAAAASGAAADSGAAAASGAAGSGDPTPAPTPYPPLTGPPTRSDVFSVQDAGSQPEGSSLDRGELAEGGEGLDSEPAPLDPALVARREELDAQIAGLEVELAKEERRLKELISESREVDGQPAPLYGVPELEELARRFPELQAQIAALRAERRALDQAN